MPALRRALLPIVLIVGLAPTVVPAAAPEPATLEIPVPGSTPNPTGR